MFNFQFLQAVRAALRAALLCWLGKRDWNGEGKIDKKVQLLSQQVHESFTLNPLNVMMII